MNVRRERGRGSWLIVILEEAGELVLIFQVRMEMLPNRPGMLVAQAVIEPLVVGVIEAL